MQFSSFVSVIVISLAMGSTVLAQSSVADLPASKNYLVNYSIDFLNKNPQADSLEDFSKFFALDVRNSNNKAVLFASVNEALVQISQETVAGMEAYLKTGSYADYVRSVSGNDRFRLVVTIKDQRLSNMVETSFLSNGILGATMTQLHSLNAREFATFADSFIQTLKSTQANLAQANVAAEAAYIRDELKNNSSLLEEVPAERAAKYIESIKASAKKRYAESFQVNVTVAARLLFELASAGVAKENMTNPEAEILKEQRLRALGLMERALTETNVFSEGQREAIVKAVKNYSEADLENVQDKKLKNALKEAYLSKEVQEMTLKVKSTAASPILTCSGIF